MKLFFTRKRKRFFLYLIFITIGISFLLKSYSSFVKIQKIQKKIEESEKKLEELKRKRDFFMREVNFLRTEEGKKRILKEQYGLGEKGERIIYLKESF